MCTLNESRRVPHTRGTDVTRPVFYGSNSLLLMQTVTLTLNPLPAPGNGGHLETPLSRLTPNVGENRLDFMPGTPPQRACATLVG